MTSMQARHFVELGAHTASKAGQGAVVCSPYDAELFRSLGGSKGRRGWNT